jgi:DNA-binding CsgD family transcriptional regulator
MSKDYIFYSLIMATISVVIVFDVTSDLMEGSSLAHVTAEGFVFSLSLIGFFLLLRDSYLIKKQNRELRLNLERSEKDLAVWKKDAEKYLQGLGDAIDRQMSRWHFTPAEKEVGLLLLKGFSFKEIAVLRKTSERTARQQSLEIYRKASLGGRAEFSAFFLEDLLLPSEELINSGKEKPGSKSSV